MRLWQMPFECLYGLNGLCYQRAPFSATIQSGTNELLSVLQYKVLTLSTAAARS